MLGYVGLGCGLLGVILLSVGMGRIVSTALEVSKRSKDGFVNQDGGKTKDGEPVTSNAFAKEFGPLIILTAKPSKDVSCTKMFEGLGKPYLKPNWNTTAETKEWSCSMFNGVKEVATQRCEMEFKNICAEDREVGSCAELQQVASVEYPTCKDKDCKWGFAVWPWNNDHFPSFNIAFDSENNVAPIGRANCVYGSQTMARFMELFWADGPLPWTPDNKTNRRLTWASFWFLAIGIGAGVASRCAGADSPAQDEVGAELMS